MDVKPKIEDICEDTEFFEVVRPILEALSAGGAFVAVHDRNDYLRYTNEAFRQAFHVELGQSVTFSSMILDAARTVRR